MPPPSRLLFICGSLVPGKDGVGDYCRRLAGALTDLGVEVRLLAAFDKEVTEPRRELQEDGGHRLPALRLPFATPAADRDELLREAIDEFDPDVLSLQYVPYSFSPYGIPLPFIHRLGRLPVRGDWHVMFHELWITHRGWRTPKPMAIALLQRLSVAAVARSLRPRVVHTHIPGYRERLRRLGITARPLPLFANIGPRPDAPAPVGDPATFRLGFFSQLIVERTLGFIADLRAWLRETDGRALHVVLLGGGKEKIAEARALLTEAFPDVSVEAPGFLPADRLSDALRTLDLGITPVDHHLVGKSGTVSAFLAHGIPVAAPYVTESGSGFFAPEYSDAILRTFAPADYAAAAAAVGQLDTSIISAAGVARTFLNDLGDSPAPPHR